MEIHVHIYVRLSVHFSPSPISHFLFIYMYVVLNIFQKQGKSTGPISRRSYFYTWKGGEIQCQHAGAYNIYRYIISFNTQIENS